MLTGNLIAPDVYIRKEENAKPAILAYASRTFEKKTIPHQKQKNENNKEKSTVKLETKTIEKNKWNKKIVFWKDE